METPKFCLMCGKPLEMSVEKTKVTEVSFVGGKEVNKVKPQKRVSLDCGTEGCQWSYEVESSEPNDQTIRMWR